MTNHWNDIDNASLVLVFGANPAENHPACMAHVNAARYGSKNAKLVVIDPRNTRTALQCNSKKGEFYVRIRPGTDIALINGLLRYILNNTTYNATAMANLLAWHNGTAANSTNNVVLADRAKGRTFVADDGTTAQPIDTEWDAAYYSLAPGVFPLATGYPKYCDTRFKVNAAGTDYQRDVLNVQSKTIAGFPVIAANVSDTDSVYQKLKAHVEPYSLATVAAICGCSTSDITRIAQTLIDNSRFASSDFGAAASTPAASTYKVTTILYAMGQTQHTCGAQNIKGLAVLQTLLGNMGRAGGGINALRGIHNVQGSTDMGLLFDSIPAYSGNPAVGATWLDYMNPLFGNRLTNTAKAASAVVNTTAVNSDVTFTAVTAGAAGNSITVTYVAGAPSTATTTAAAVGNAITVTLSTDAGGLVTATANDVKAACDGAPAVAALVTTAVEGTGLGLVNAIGPVSLTGGFDVNGYQYSTAKMGLQQRGFHNMTTEWFGNGTSSGADVAALYDCWPKGNGYQHIEAIRRMSDATEATRIKAAVVWGQNPCVTEPNQAAVRAGFKNLDLLVVTDMFETETAACDRKALGVTYLIPACAHPEEAGSVTNSGRWLQWRERACAPKGNSKADLELLLRLAYALDNATAGSAFSHIITKWGTLGTPIVPSVASHAYAELFGKYGWTPGAGAFEAVTASREKWDVGATAPTTTALYGSEVIAENIYQEMCRPLGHLASGGSSTTTGGTMWIYSGSDAGGTVGVGGWNAGASALTNVMPAFTNAWQVYNRAKSRDNTVAGGALTYSRWGWSWLLNRRVFYNNGEVPNDQSDTFVSPGLVSCLFTISTNTFADFSLVYRAYKTFKDKPSAIHATHADYNINSPHFQDPGVGTLSYAGRFPGHTEPYESPASAAIKTAWGKNTSLGSDLITTAAWGTVPATPIGDVATYPLVLTTIRCVEHFQGGPITRNNAWNVEQEPEPWIEINSADTVVGGPAAGIVTGDWVNVITARSNSTTDQTGRTRDPGTLATPYVVVGTGTDTFGKGFRARVGVGTTTSQRVAPGVVAIPWHWGDRGLSTGSRANDLCIDSWDANTMIPEYKACLCRIVKA